MLYQEIFISLIFGMIHYFQNWVKGHGNILKITVTARKVLGEKIFEYNVRLISDSWLAVNLTEYQISILAQHLCLYTLFFLQIFKSSHLDKLIIKPCNSTNVRNKMKYVEVV